MFRLVLTEPELVGAGSLLRKYLNLLCAHVADVLPVAASLATPSGKHFATVAKIVSADVSGNACIQNIEILQR